MNLMKWGMAIFISIFAFSAPAVRAADTIETFDEGAVDFEFYLGGDGLNLPEYEKSVYGEMLLGYGLLPRFSGYLALCAASNEYMMDGEGGYSFGLLGTPLDSDFIDLDLLLDVGMGGEGMAEMGVTPGLELNFDLKPDLELWGLYARIEDAMSGRDESVPDDPDTPDVDESKTKYVLAQAVYQTYGTYFTIAERHQILAEYYHIYNVKPEKGELEQDSDGFALGYNISILDNLELITHVHAHPGHDHQDATWGASVGIIATIPRVPDKPADGKE